ncbi:MAG: hypothetical protein MJ134_00315 [Lachnospiraceae bacterium]|nr:hypothetical protein [Lachnospiraceae bacterium]
MLMGIVTIIVLFIPYSKSGIWEGFDIGFHMSRIWGCAEAMKAGIFPVKLHPVSCFTYGYGVGFFYSNLLIYIPAILVVLGVPLLISYKIFVFLMLLASFLLVIYCLYSVCHSVLWATLGTVFFMCCKYMTYTLYLSMSLGSLCSFMFTIPAILGLYRVIVKEESPVMFILGFVWLLYTHTITAFLTFIACFVFCLCFIDRVLKKKVLMRLVSSVFITLWISMSHLLPMLEQFKSQVFKVSAPWDYAKDHVLTLSNLTKEWMMGPLTPMVLILCLIIFLCSYKNISTMSKRGIITFLLISFGFICITMIQSFWDFCNLTLGIHIIQSPSRLFLIVVALLTCAIACLGENSKIVYSGFSKKYILCPLIILFGMYQGYQSFPEAFNKHSSLVDQEILSGEIAGLGGGEEWLPVEASREKMIEANQVADNLGEISFGEKHNHFSTFSFLADFQKGYYDIPYVYYRGYTARDEGGNRYSIDLASGSGLVRVFMPDNKTGTAKITVTYEPTKWQLLGYAGSMSCIIFLLLFYYWKRRKG